MTRPASTTTGGKRAARPDPARAEEEVSRAIIALYMAEPFFAHVVQGLARRIDDSTPTAGVALVGSGIQLWVNPAFFATLKKDERVAVVKHEILHVILKHLVRAEGKGRRLWNLACDVVVNDLVGRWPLPAGAVTRGTFPDLGIPDDATADQVYKLLGDLQREVDSVVPTAEESADDAGQPGAQGQQGTPDFSGTSAPRSARALHGMNGTEEAGAIGGHSDHGAWNAAGNADLAGEAANVLAADAAIDGMLVRAADRTSAQGWGSLPGRVRAAVDAARQRGKPKVDWKRTLRLFAAGAGRTKVVGTQRRESTRYNTFPGTKIKRLHQLLVAVDTSGSIGQPQLDAFFDEIHGIFRSGAKVRVVVCDAAVHEDFDYKGRQPIQIGGGGGTSFEPVFRWMHAQRRLRFDACIYLTDGHGPAPATQPPCRVLWVVTETSGMGDHLKFGRAIHLDLT